MNCFINRVYDQEYMTQYSKPYMKRHYRKQFDPLDYVVYINSLPKLEPFTWFVRRRRIKKYDNFNQLRRNQTYTKCQEYLTSM